MKVFSLLLLLCLSTSVVADSKPLIFVSILPQKYFVDQVSQGLVDVEVMVGPGQNPTTYEPTPGTISRLSRADMYMAIGVPFEQAWLRRIQQNYPNLEVVHCCEEIIDLSIASHDHGDSHHHAIEDPHVWTSPKNVIAITRLIEKHLVQLDPANSEEYASAATAFIQRLSALDQEITAMTRDLSKRKMIVTHPAWSFYAADYGLLQLSIERKGKDIQAASLRNLIEEARREQIKAVFTQPQFNDKAARVIAMELGGIIYSLDPLAYDYIANMLSITRSITDGLNNE